MARELTVVRYAYVHKRHGRERSGLLEACDVADARRHLGSAYRIKKIDVPYVISIEAMLDGDVKWKVVAEAFGIEEGE
jgi:hypothetical protein